MHMYLHKSMVSLISKQSGKTAELHYDFVILLIAPKEMCHLGCLQTKRHKRKLLSFGVARVKVEWAMTVLQGGNKTLFHIFFISTLFQKLMQ